MNSLDVEGVYVFVKERFDERLAYNFKGKMICLIKITHPKKKFNSAY